MEEELIEEIKDEIPKLLPEVYKDLAQPAVQEIGQVTGRTAKALLSPIRGMLWGWERIEKMVTDGVSKRLDDIPDERKKTPEPEIAVPLMQALNYTAQNETLREMYLNLLGNSMDSDKEKVVHPSFVELIKQMNSLDAKVFERLAKYQHYQKIINPNISIKDQGKFFTGATPEWFIGWTIENHDIFEISSSLIRLDKFGLIELMYDRTAGKDGYDDLKNSKVLNDILQRYQQANPSIELIVNSTNSIVYVNEYGLQFKHACT